MSNVPLYIQGADLPDLTIAWKNQDGQLIDFSTGYTFTLNIGQPGSPAAFTKTSGITGAATSPNVLIEWATTGELNTLAPGAYTADLTATRDADSRHRIMRLNLRVLPAITTPA